MTITREIGGVQHYIELTDYEMQQVYREHLVKKNIAAVKSNVEGTILSFVLTDDDYAELAKLFEPNCELTRKNSDIWYNLIDIYKKERLTNRYANTTWGAVAITTEHRLELLDDNEQFIEYFELDNMSDTEIAELFEKCRDALLDSDEAYARFFSKSFDTVVKTGKCENGAYETACDEYGEEYVNKIGNYFVVVE